MPLTRATWRVLLYPEHAVIGGRSAASIARAEARHWSTRADALAHAEAMVADLRTVPGLEVREIGGPGAGSWRFVEPRTGVRFSIRLEPDGWEERP